MPNGDPARQNGTLLSGKNVGTAGAAGAVGMFLFSMFSSMQNSVATMQSNMTARIDSVEKDSKIAVEVAKQHGQEFVDVRSEIRAVDASVARIAAQMDLGGRFTSDDADRLRASLQADMGRIEASQNRIHDRLQRLEEKFLKHERETVR